MRIKIVPRGLFYEQRFISKETLLWAIQLDWFPWFRSAADARCGYDTNDVNRCVFLWHLEGDTLEEIGARFGIGRERTRQRFLQCLNRILRLLENIQHYERKEYLWTKAGLLEKTELAENGRKQLSSAWDMLIEGQIA